MFNLGEEDGYDEFIPDEVKAWLEHKREETRIRHYILVNGKIKSASLLEWAIRFEDINNRRVDYTDISNEPNYPDGEYVSTVFLGIDHRTFSSGLPLIYETLISGGKYDNKLWRFSTYGEAKKGHWAIVDAIRSGSVPEPINGEASIFNTFLDMIDEWSEGEDETDEPGEIE